MFRRHVERAWSAKKGLNARRKKTTRKQTRGNRKNGERLAGAEMLPSLFPPQPVVLVISRLLFFFSHFNVDILVAAPLPSSKLLLNRVCFWLFKGGGEAN